MYVKCYIGSVLDFFSECLFIAMSDVGMSTVGPSILDTWDQKGLKVSLFQGLNYMAKYSEAFSSSGMCP